MENSEGHTFGRQFDTDYIIISELTRSVIDNLVLYCKEEINNKEFKYLIVEIMKILNIPMKSKKS